MKGFENKLSQLNLVNDSNQPARRKLYRVCRSGDSSPVSESTSLGITNIYTHLLYNFGYGFFLLPVFFVAPPEKLASSQGPFSPPQSRAFVIFGRSRH